MDEALKEGGKTHSDIQLVAVTKKQNISKIQECLDCGLFNFGENYLQEALVKLDEYPSGKINWHFIGTVQSKKVKDLLGRFYLWHGVDRLSVLTEIAKRNKGPAQNVLLQINIANEKSKSGILLDDISDFIEEAKNLSGFSIKGLMAMPPVFKDEKKSRFYFSEMKKLLLTCQKLIDSKTHPMNELSMGTSQDYTWAIQEGATIVRLGEVLVGPREY